MACTPNTTPELAPFTFAYKVVHCAPIYLEVYPLSLPLLLEELEIVDRIVELINENTYARVCAYMIGNLIVFFVMFVLIKFAVCVNLLPPPDDISFLRAAHTIYVQHSKFPEALGLSIRLGDPDLIRQDFNVPGNP
jgi:26S proteasome regulatory subunit N1